MSNGLKADCSSCEWWAPFSLPDTRYCSSVASAGTSLSKVTNIPVLCVLQIDYFNNQVIVDLVEQQHKGIIAILDDACMNVGKVTDEMFLEALNNKLGKHAHFSSRKVMSPLYPQNLLPFLRDTFSISLDAAEKGKRLAGVGIDTLEREMKCLRAAAAAAPNYGVCSGFRSRLGRARIRQRELKDVQCEIGFIPGIKEA